MTHPPADSYEAMAQANDDTTVVDLGLGDLPELESEKRPSTPGFRPGVAQEIAGTAFNDDGGPKPPPELVKKMKDIMDAPPTKGFRFMRSKVSEEEKAERKLECRRLYAAWQKAYQEHAAKERENYLFESINRTPRADGMSGFVAIFGENGGCGKSMVSANLSYDLARIRMERTALVDVNPAYSSLAGRMRVEQDPSKSLPAMLRQASQDPSGLTHPMRYMDKVAGLDLRVLWGGADSRSRGSLTKRDIETTAACLNEHFIISVFDTGAGTENPAAHGSVEVCDSLVMVSENAIDALNYVNIGLNTIKGILAALGMEYVPMILVINHTKPDEVYGSEKIALEVRDTIHRRFQDDFREIIDIPYDLALATGGPIDFDRRREDTKTAFMELASAVMGDLSR